MGQQLHLLSFPSFSSTPLPRPSFSFDLSTIYNIMKPLGIPWNPISKKGHNFQSFFNYVGFEWDITSRSVSLSSEKCLCLLSKVSTLILAPHPRVSKKSIASIHGSLQHITIIYPQGRLHLAPLTNFLSKFPNDHVLHNMPKSCIDLLSWWLKILALPCPSRALKKLPEIDLGIWVDASTSWGIGLCMDNAWAAWHLLEGWKLASWGIG